MNLFYIYISIFIWKFVYAFKTLGASSLSDHKYEPLSNNSKQTVIHVFISWNSTGEPFGLMCPDFSIKCLIKRHHFL